MHQSPKPTRREGLKAVAGAAAAAWLQSSFAALAFPAPAEGETPIPFLDDQPVSAERAMLERFPNWPKYLAGPTGSEQEKIIRLHSRTGRPAGDEVFVRKLEALTGRNLWPSKPGPKRFT
jgi:hypothetical protein